jgi:ATP synthase protein I
MQMIKPVRGSKPNGALAASSAPRSPWMGILKTCTAYTFSVGAAVSLVLWPILGAQFAGSIGFAVGLVIIFFGVSLLIAELAGRYRSSWALPAFLFTYMLKIVGMGFLVLFSGLPDWVYRPAFMWGAIGALVLWQFGEIRAFSKARLPIFDDEEPTPPGSGEAQHGNPR